MSLADARQFIAAARPRSPDVHLLGSTDLDGADAGHLFVADGSRLYDAAPGLLHGFERALESGDREAVAALLAEFGLSGPPRIDDEPLSEPPLHAISLAVAQKCNLGCSYCYAGQGEFGGAPADMALDTARRAIDLLIAGVKSGERVTIAFLGGEPLANRRVLRAATGHAVARAAEAGVTAGFSITTNGTLVTPDDADFFEAHGFAVTVSLDGPRAMHDSQRPFRNGGGSFDRIMARIAPLLERQRAMQVSARVTVTVANMALKETLDQFIEAGFHSVGFSPMLSSPNGLGELQSDDLEIMLGQMIDCGREYERQTLAGRRYPFANMANAMKEIARGTHRPYPCGAGAGYMGVSADGALAACHRFVGDAAGAMGSLDAGIDRDARTAWLTSRHVHAQSPCGECWARYLCGGGCHHEVIGRGRPACDYIRGWLQYCLGAWLRLSSSMPAGGPPGRPERG